MISVQKVLVLVGILVFGCLLAYAQGIDIQDGTTEKDAAQQDIEQIGKDATVILYPISPICRARSLGPPRNANFIGKLQIKSI